MAIQPSKLTIAFLAVLAVCLAGWIMDFTRTVAVSEDGRNTELHVYIESRGEAKAVSEFQRLSEKAGEHTGVFSTLWRFNSTRFHDALKSLFAFDVIGVVENIAVCLKAAVWALKYHFLYCIVFVVIKLGVLSIAGGAICRIAALQFARGEKPGLTEALRFGTSKFLSLFTAPLVVVGIIVVIGVLVFLLGLIGNIPRAGELIMAIFAPLTFLAGALIAVVLIGAVVGFNLMFPAVAYDGSDCFDAVSRSFSYVYSRPWRMAFYTGLAAVYGAICYMFVRFFAFLMLMASYCLLDVGILSDADGGSKLSRVWTAPAFFSLTGPNSDLAQNWSETLAAFCIHLFVLVVVGLLISFIMSFYFSANTIIYSLLRKWVDNTALEEVYTYSEESDTGFSAGASASAESGTVPEEESESSP
ncbi:MAG: hypothetical protein ACYTEQ_04255 [Planctomycetota bacterium]|jgi:hypothetical protein